ncbi:IS30 family transposase [Streptomyces rhizosphaerihabitans]|uniref:IS30 family transposase n=1 Tax=Streptomyces rhizosphaerihabitans TaxID=1266770 RepID=UPI0021C0441B|nr:IS30 family transposase [Streptomyces rhizosphaerihabitans]MCT9004593.1 IS30 family transposase [Streptomyces rhizosphaerihabitans]
MEERPQAAEDRSESGHLEGDLVIGSNNSQIATLVDRKSRFLTVVKLASRHTTVVVPALAETYERMDPRLRSTLTWDRGMELAAHKRLTADTGVDVFFAAPGNVAPTRTPTSCSGSTCPKARTCRRSARTILTPSRRSSTTVRASAWDSAHQPRALP